MAFVTQTIQQVFDSGLAFIESQINQETPGADKAYNKVLAGFMSLLFGSLLKFATDRAKEALTISASIAGLTVIGQGRNITRQPATSTVLIFTVPAVTSTVIETSVIYTGDSNGVRYKPNAQVVAVAGVATITATALTPGVVGNLANGLTLTADRQVSGAEAQGTVTSTTTTGVDQEEVEVFRQRILDDERTEGGGSNSADHRRWAGLTPGVQRGFPYTGDPTFLQTGAGTIEPVAKSIFIRADESLGTNGVADSTLLALAEEYIKTNQDTQQANEALTCDLDSFRNVLSIFNTTFFVTVNNLVISVDVEAQVKADIQTAVELYFRSVEPFIEDLDFVDDKNDTITNPSVASVVEDVVKAGGGSFTGVTVTNSMGTVVSYPLGVGELALLDAGGVQYDP